MGDTSWKRHEREIAKALGGYRTGPTGTDTTDVSGINVGVECKYQGKLALRKADIEQAKRNARELPWVLVLKEKRGQTLAVMDFDLFAKMYNVIGDLYNLLPRYSCKADEPDGCPVCVARELTRS